MQNEQFTSISQQEADIYKLQQDLEQINKSLLDATTAHTAILLVNKNGNVLQANNYFYQIFAPIINPNDFTNVKILPITDTYGSCSNNEWFDFLTSKNEGMLPKVEITINEKLFYFTIISTIIENIKDSSNTPLSYIISLTDITNVVEMHKNEISISKELAYKQGIFDVTSEYIHNIGNIITGAQFLSGKIIKNLEPIQFFFKYFNYIKEQLEGNVAYVKDDLIEEYKKNSKKIEMSLNIIESSLTDTIKNILDSDMKNLQKAINNIATTITYQQELYKNTKNNMDEVVKFKDLVMEIRSVIEPQLTKNSILLILEVDTPELSFKINRIHLFNGLLNLLKNSIYALNLVNTIDKTFDKYIKITIKSMPVEGSFFELDMISNDSIVMDENIIIEVFDNGIGMDAETLRNVFLQGFTTKKDGHGLGLHSFANFLTSNGHSIVCRSDGINKGSLFTITLSPKGMVQ